ncbi:MAG TPA: hypothetical protein VMB50_13585 [Myxococcales bacterium]|nr:hypothetical protein [Myxococcales bacterium]
MPDELEKKYKDYPDCCRKVLLELDREGRTGARNCAKGHLCRALPVPPQSTPPRPG